MTLNQLAALGTAPAAKADEFLEEVLHGLSLPQKALPSRFFYDARGSDLFEQITDLPEYYLTRTEIALLASRGANIGSFIQPDAVVVEFGSGSSRKTELLLSALDRPRAYIPIDISTAALFPAASRIGQTFPSLLVHPVPASFHNLDAVDLPYPEQFHLGFFPGSTIGNLTRPEAVLFLRSVRRFLGEKAALLVGADLQKPLHMLLPAYNDEQKVTAAFNLNILARVNRELSGTFDLSAFAHEAIYNESEGRVEMHLRSAKRQEASVAGKAFSFREGETIHTENSHKYSVPRFQSLAVEGGWRPIETWVDADGLFSLHLLV
jgi:dimethylhistidine N-methyltransferase